MKMKFILLSCLVVINLNGDTKQDVPTKLFDIELGKIYDLGDDKNPNGNIPITKMAGTSKFAGEGFHYYFEPQKEYNWFKYAEDKKNDNNFYKTSFSLYILPLIPDTIKTLSELNEQYKSRKLNYEVAGIRWNDGFQEDNKNNENYYWAKELCETFTLEINQKPKILDDFERKWYQCEFVHNGRELKVFGYGFRSISLDYVNEKFDKKNNEIRDKIRLLNLKENKPY